jgi:hypothetical protein
MLPLTHIGEQKHTTYFSAVHGRNSYDNLGAAIKVTCIMTLLMTMLTGKRYDLMTDGSDTYFDVQ